MGADLGDLRHLVGDIDPARMSASYELGRAESRATESVDVVDSLLCYICHERRKDTALKCLRAPTLRGPPARGRVHVCPECAAPLRRAPAS